jgi:hypothetical protein
VLNLEGGESSHAASGLPQHGVHCLIAEAFAVNEREEILTGGDSLDVDRRVILPHLRVVDAGRLVDLVVCEEVIPDGQTVIALVRPGPVAFDGHLGDQLRHLLGREVE